MVERPQDRAPEGAGDRYDAGLAAERTHLSWNRSGLAVLAVVALMLRHLWPLEGWKTVAALALIAAGGALWALGMRHAIRAPGGRHAIRAPGGAAEPLGEPACRMLMAGTLLLAAAGLVVGAAL